MASSESEDRDRLPFEPGKGRKKENKGQSKAPKGVTPKSKQANGKKGDRKSAIPDYVNKRMFRRMAIFGGAPSLFGIVFFFLSYYVIVSETFALPNVVVLIVTLSCFGLGFAGLSYGTLSASWDPEEGSLLGFREIGTNLRRLQESRAINKQKKQEQAESATSSAEDSSSS